MVSRPSASPICMDLRGRHGERLRHLMLARRIDMGWTQAELGEACNMCPSQLSNTLALRKPSLTEHNLTGLSRGLNLSPGYLTRLLVSRDQLPPLDEVAVALLADRIPLDDLALDKLANMTQTYRDNHGLNISQMADRLNSDPKSVDLIERKRLTGIIQSTLGKHADLHGLTKYALMQMLMQRSQRRAS